MDLPLAPSIASQPESPLPAGHLNANDLPWVEQYPGIEMKILRVSDDTGTWIIMNRFAPGTQLPKHRHSGGVVAYTLQGRWRYLEYDFVATAGSVIREPANSSHTLSVPADAGEPAVIFFVVEGSLTHFGDNGEIWGISDGHTQLAEYLALAAAQGHRVTRAQVLA